MQEDFLNELGELALGSRLKRLADRLMTQANDTYREFGHDMQPRWFVLLALLNEKTQVSVVEAAEYLGVSQPAVSQFSRDLEDRKWLKVAFDKKDGRKRQLKLTASGKTFVSKLQPMWQAVDKAAKELCEEVSPNFFNDLIRLEQAVKAKSLTARALEHAKKSGGQ